MRLDHLLSKKRQRSEVVDVNVFHCSVINDWQNLAAIRPGATPVPMPNTTVKTRPADGTALETVRESRRPPVLFLRSRAEGSAEAPGCCKAVRRRTATYLENRIYEEASK